MNAQIGKSNNNNLFLHNSPNRNHVYLAEFTLDKKLAYLNSKFLKRGGIYEPTLTQISSKHS